MFDSELKEWNTKENTVSLGLPNYVDRLLSLPNNYIPNRAKINIKSKLEALIIL